MLALVCQLGKWLREFTVRIEIYGKSLLFFFVQTVITVCHECDLTACALFPSLRLYVLFLYQKPSQTFCFTKCLTEKVGNLSVT